ncbi:MAG: DNA-processing protein DprA [Fimbriimonadaceae bacterium]|nr:DNA-processing protein DprA [Fimbriimonadaceae bacterium]
MERGELLTVRACLAALYLRGVDRPWQPVRRKWPRVVSVLCSAAPSLGLAPRVLRAAGLADEADVLAEPGVAEAGARYVESRLVLTAACPEYPCGWRAALGSFAPPALWSRGEIPAGPIVGVVGSRQPGWEARSFTESLARGLLQAGASIVSGGCHGVDRAAARAALEAGGAGRVLEVLPCGLDHALPREGIVQLSACSPGAPFSAGQAMERNALIYALGRRAIAVQPRRGAGGTWAGALDALRRRLAVVGVHPGLGGGGEAALVALGAHPFAVPEGEALASFLALDVPILQPGLFGASEVRERLAWPA